MIHGYAVLDNGKWPITSLRLVEGGFEMVFTITPGHPLKGPSIIAIEDMDGNISVIGMLGVSIDVWATSTVSWKMKVHSGLSEGAKEHLELQYDKLLSGDEDDN